MKGMEKGNQEKVVTDAMVDLFSVPTPREEHFVRLPGHSPE